MTVRTCYGVWEQWLQNRLPEEGKSAGALEESKTYSVSNVSEESAGYESTSAITIRVSNPAEISQLKELAERLGLDYHVWPSVSTTGTDSGALDWLKEIADRGGVKGIEDPVSWQKKERRDRSLPMR